MLVLLSGCKADFSDPEPPETFGNIKYSAEIKVIHNGAVTFYNAFVTLHNQTGGAQTRTYPVSCPVQIRLYRLGDNVVVYDETRRVCDKSHTAELTINGTSDAMLYSGNRTAGSILGDSLPAATYGARVVVNTEGNKEALIYAGTVTF